MPYLISVYDGRPPILDSRFKSTAGVTQRPSLLFGCMGLLSVCSQKKMASKYVSNLLFYAQSTITVISGRPKRRWRGRGMRRKRRKKKREET